MTTQETLVYVGTYTRGDSEGVYLYKLDRGTGDLTLVGPAPRVESPSYLAISPTQEYLYAACEVGNFRGESSGAVAAFRIDPDSGELALLNQQPTGGPGPCYVSVDATGSYAFAANYSGGSVAMLPIKDDGSLGEPSDFHQHEGSSVNERRQEKAHAHCAVPSPHNRHLFVCDLGMDKIMSYEMDLDHGKLVPNDVPWTTATPGAGPRHLVFHSNGDLVFVANELASSITSYRFDSEAGTLEAIQTVPGLPEDFEGQNTAADIHVSPDGRFVYASMRGHDSIAIYSVDPYSGEMTYVNHESSGGNTPRNFAIDPSGSFLLAAHQDSDNVVVFRIDQESGRLAATGHEVQVPKPVCVKMITR